MDGLVSDKPTFEQRFEDLGPIGAGGMGEVRRVRERQLGRILAMKVIRARLRTDDVAHARFAEEARMTAWLEHPSIIPVHHVGRLPDGRLYYTMPEVHGQTLSEAIREVHEAVGGGAWRPTDTGLSFRRLIENFRRACDAVAYAHEHGIVHGDLKPDNVMLGPHGEVFVLDWGLARVVQQVPGAPGPESAARALLGLEQPLAEDERIVGTLAYLAPERLWNAALDRPGDVYALGAMFYEILAGVPPYGGGDPSSVLQRLAIGPPDPVDEVAAGAGAPESPADLVSLVESSMQRDVDQRPASAAAVAAEVGAWLEGTRQLERAQELVAEAHAARDELADVRATAADARSEAARLMSDLSPRAPAKDKQPAWDMEARAETLDRRAARLEAEFTQGLYAALAVVTDLPAAHESLARYYRDRHEGAEARGDPLTAERDATQLRYHDRVGRHDQYLRGDGALTLWTDPQDVQVEILEYVEQGRRLVPRPIRILGNTPLWKVSLPMGSYLLRLRRRGYDTVRYPVRIGRGQDWDGVPPGGQVDPGVVPLPPAGSLGTGDCYVPAGWFLCGGDPSAPGCLVRDRVWLDGFVMRRDPVTHSEFVAFLDHLVGSGQEERALALAPRLGASPSSEAGQSLYGRDGQGRFTLEGGVAGIEVIGDRPAVCVSWTGADAYARWRAAEDGRAWRLPGELEWEKAARGVDGRFFPWGDHLDPTWCCMRDSHPQKPSMASVGEFPVDESPYGVRGMAGNVRDWCADPFRPLGPELHDGAWRYREPPASGVPRVGRGGTWCVNPVSLRAAYRSWFAPSFRSDDSLGFRLACSYPDGWTTD